jgi:hypothetical protein
MVVELDRRRGVDEGDIVTTDGFAKTCSGRVGIELNNDGVYFFTFKKNKRGSAVIEHMSGDAAIQKRGPDAAGEAGRANDND